MFWPQALPLTPSRPPRQSQKSVITLWDCPELPLPYQMTRQTTLKIFIALKISGIINKKYKLWVFLNKWIE